MSIVIKPPEQLFDLPAHERILSTKLFLAGSIEQGKAEPWQERVETALQDEENLIVLNPRRDHWDPTWDQSPSNPAFLAQVNWELDMQDKADIIAFYFDPNTKSPITLLELGLAMDQSVKKVVCCPASFWRSGNVSIVCKRWEQYGDVKLCHDFDTFLDMIREEIMFQGDMG